MDATYRKNYLRGWNAATRAMNNDRDGVDGLSTLERADARNESNAWYDGYMDNACDNGKFAAAEGR